MNIALRLGVFELAGLVRRRWFVGAVLIGVGAVVAGALVASSHSGQVRADSFRAAAASVMLVGGLSLAIALGATAIARGGQTGHLGLLVGSGASRTTVTAARVGARLGAFLLGLGVWLVALQVGSLALGRGLDGPLAVHVAASAETLTVVLLLAAAVSTVLGPSIAGIVGAMGYVTIQAVVNLKAAADTGLLGAWGRASQIAYNVLPRAVLSPMIVDMQNRGEGGPAAPRFEVALDATRDLGVGADKVPVPLFPAGVGTVFFTLFWCAAIAYLCALGMRRRTL